MRQETIEPETIGAEISAPSVEGDTAPAGRVNFGAVLRHAGFRNLWLGQIVSQIGDYFAMLALIVVVAGFGSGTAETTAAVTGLMIALTVPRLLFGVLAGVFVDRWDRRRTMIASDLLRFVLALGLIPAFLSRQVLLLYALAFALSAIGTLFIPAKGALIPWLVPREQLLAANALSQTSQTLAQFVGPALAGATFAAAGAGNQWVAFAIDALSFLISALAIWRIRAPAAARTIAAAPAGSGREAVRRVWAELLVGLRALLLNRTIATLTVVFAILNLGIGALNVLWVVFLRTQFGFTAGDLAWRLSVIDIAFAGGMVLSSMVIGNVAARIAPKWLIACGLLVSGLILAGIGYVPGYEGVVAAMAGIGLFVAPIMTGSQTLMQIAVPNDQLGRVGGGLGTATDTATLLSMGLAGVLAGALGIPFVFLLSGLLCTAAGALAWARLPALTLPAAASEPVPIGESAPA